MDRYSKINVVLGPEYDRGNNIQIFIDAIWYCRLIFPGAKTFTEDLCDTKCSQKNHLPPLVSEKEMELMIGIQLLVLTACGCNINYIKAAGDKVGTALELVETAQQGACLNTWSSNSPIIEFLPNHCIIYLVKHTAYLFHKFKKLGPIILNPIKYDKERSSSKKSGKPMQPTPDHYFKQCTSLFVFEELFILSEFYDFTSDVVQKVFTRLKSIAPYHLLLADIPDLDSLYNQNSVLYGTFDANRKSNKKNVNWFLNPILQTKVVQNTKKLMKSFPAQILNGCFPQPRILDFQLMRQKNLPLPAIYLNPQLLNDPTIDSDWFDVLVQRENDIKFYADGLGGLSKRLVRNGRVIFGGSSGSIIANLAKVKSYSEDEKYMFMFHDPEKSFKLYKNKDSKSLKNLFVVGGFVSLTNGKLNSIRPVATIVGPGKTTSLNPMILDLALAYEKLFDDNRVLILKMKTQQIGTFKLSTKSLNTFALQATKLPGSFQMDTWANFDCFNKLNETLCFQRIFTGGVALDLNYSRQNFSKLSIAILSDSVPAVDNASKFHNKKRTAKTYSNESKVYGVSVEATTSTKNGKLILTVEVDVGVELDFLIDT